LKVKVKYLSFLAGIIGPVFFGIMVTTLTLLEYDFLRTLGWHLLYAPTPDWPSGPVLGHYGKWMTLTIIVNCLLMILFALALGAELKPARFAQCGSAMLACTPGKGGSGISDRPDCPFHSCHLAWTFA
jgi:hypothetical protein